MSNRNIDNNLITYYYIILYFLRKFDYVKQYDRHSLQNLKNVNALLIQFDEKKIDKEEKLKAP